MTTTVNGFRGSGVFNWPVDINVFTEVDFISSATTDIQIPFDDAVTKRTSSEHTQSSTPQRQITQQPLTSTFLTTKGPIVTIFEVASPENILPIPKVGFAKGRKSSKQCEKTAVLTKSPYKATKHNCCNNKMRRKMKASKRKSFPASSKPKKTVKTNSTKKEIK